MKQRRARAEVAPVVADLSGWAADHDLSGDFGGSWRRGCETVGDLDLVLFQPSFDGVVWPDGFELVRSGRQVVQAVYGGIQVDVWACPVECRAAFMWFVTGPADLNVAMRSRAKRYGWTLNQWELRGYDRPLVTETDLAVALAVPDLTPAERDRWRTYWGWRTRRADLVGTR